MNIVDFDITKMVSVDDINYILTMQKPFELSTTVFPIIQYMCDGHNMSTHSYLFGMIDRLFLTMLSKSVEIDMPFLTLCDIIPGVVCSLLTHNKDVYNAEIISMCATSNMFYRYDVAFINKRYIIDVAAVMQAPYRYLSDYLISIDRLDLLSRIDNDCTFTKLLKDNILTTQDIINICKFPHKTFVIDIITNPSIYIL